MRKDTSVPQTESQKELEQLRTVILGQDHHLIIDAVNDQAREIVGKVLTEALHDRQKKDGSVDKILRPIVENSVEHSVSHHSDRFIAYLYPLTGSLVRKSVSAFLTDFIEKTNQLIEHSFTIKGLKWRIKAWQSGVSFAQYAVSQSYTFRVEHILLIHQETGLLLKSVNLDQQSKNDADLISSMLIAINDFVGDSFQTNKEGLKEQLQTVSTDNFNLLLKPGPNAIIVAAVTGNPPQKVNAQLQITLENIHRLYIDEFEQFNGDSAPFDNTENELRDCLLTEERTIEGNPNKKPWFAWFLIVISIILIGFKIQNWYHLDQLTADILKIDQQPGIVVQTVSVDTEQNIMLDVMRDPDAISIEEWFNLRKLPFNNVVLKERMYRSLSPEIIAKRAQLIISQYANISTQWLDKQLLLSGNTDISKLHRLTRQLADAGIESSKVNIEQLAVVNSDELATTLSIQQQVFKDLVGKISTIQLDFDIASTEVTPNMHNALTQLVDQLTYLNKLAMKLNINVALLIMGSSDNSGNRSDNSRLSLLRAKNTATYLNRLGLNRDQMFVTGLGQIDLKYVENSARKVMFNILYVDKSP